MRDWPDYISLAQHCGPHHGARGRVERHHGRGHQAGVLLPQAQPGVESGVALQEQHLNSHLSFFFYILEALRITVLYRVTDLH